MAFPNIGDKIPAFEVGTQKGWLHFPDYILGHWSIIFAHPANFSSAWTMYSTFLSMKERWFVDHDTRLLAVSHDPIGQGGNFVEKVSRYIGIYLKAPVVEDADYRISHILGIASARKKHPEHDRLAYLVDSDGVVRLIIYNHHKPSVENVVLQLEEALNRLHRDVHPLNSVEKSQEPTKLDVVDEESDATHTYKPKPAYFRRDKLNPN